MSGKPEPVCVERRRHERTPLRCACKLLHSPTQRYMAAQTCDLSDGGALVEIRGARSLHAGDRVDVLVDWSARGLVRSAATLRATVVRLAGSDNETQRVGVAFDRPFAGALAA